MSTPHGTVLPFITAAKSTVPSLGPVRPFMAVAHLLDQSHFGLKGYRLRKFSSFRPICYYVRTLLWLPSSSTIVNTFGRVFNGYSCFSVLLINEWILIENYFQKLHTPVLLAFDANNGSRVYEWSFDSGVGKRIDVKEARKMSPYGISSCLF